MKLLASFAALLIALQVVAAVHSDQLQQPRFVKVKRTVSGHADGHKAYRLGPNLKQRSYDLLLEKVAELEKLHKAGQGISQQNQLLREIGDQVSGLQAIADPQVAARHSLKPPSESVRRPLSGEIAPAETSRAGEERGHGHFTHSQAWLDSQDRLSTHETILSGHEQKFEKIKHDAEFVDLRIHGIAKGIDDVSNDVEKAVRGRRIMNIVLASLIGGTAAVGTFGMIDDRNMINTQNDDINRLSQEVARLKAQNGQMPTSVAGPGGAVKQGVPASRQQGLV
ncbi:uncharacterized protein SRS1_11947 [Sporisorium reilianum f. sp. reilianum]|uniref:Uncharacterized protein n=1 Tax=Sporisorium reilianum f. sp. reilianum TaxID=72559 RepID=A0A2N8U7N3_9BASI|nr:uncharacterized protein SRS1_11947 [Sporisorium reilianum f. sp. reilianum]